MRLTLESVTLGDTNNVDAFILSKDSGDRDLLLEVLSGKVNLVGDASTVQLDLHDVGLLLPNKSKVNRQQSKKKVLI